MDKFHTNVFTSATSGAERLVGTYSSTKYQTVNSMLQETLVKFIDLEEIEHLMA